MFNFYRVRPMPAETMLFDQDNFYAQFKNDMMHAKSLIVIESAYITSSRFRDLKPYLESAVKRGIKIIINTRPPDTHDDFMIMQSIDAIADMQVMGVVVLYTGGLHRKLAIVDDDILWEGSLNILSQTGSCEIMRRTRSIESVRQLVRYLNFGQWYTVSKI